jgi:hypothetical protein
MSDVSCMAKIAVVERLPSWDTMKEEIVKLLGLYQTTKGERVFEAGFKTLSELYA